MDLVLRKRERERAQQTKINTSGSLKRQEQRWTEEHREINKERNEEEEVFRSRRSVLKFNIKEEEEEPSSER